MYTQIEYIRRLGAQLTNFKEKKPREWSFSHSCETNHDHKKFKSRCGIFEAKDHTGFIIHCHHCGLTTSFLKFLKDNSPSLYDEYRLSAYSVHAPAIVSKVIVPEVKLIDANLNGLIPVTALPKSTPVLDFLRRRKIPEDKYNLLYVAKHFFQWATYYKPEFKDLKDTSPRLILPYFNLHGKVIGFTARSFNPTETLRYIHLRIDHDYEFIYGTERIDPTKTIYAVEGQIDSLFISNCIAVGGAHYNTPFMQSIKTNCIIIPDSDWKRNKQVAQQVKKVILDGFKICFVPDTIKGKDVNDWIKNGLGYINMMKMIEENSYSGLKAELEFALNRRC